MLVRHADVLVTMDGGRREIRDGGVFIRGNRIEQVGASVELPQTADRVLDLAGHVVLPGLINCHHHLYQTLTRTLGTAGGLSLFDWLKTLYRVWGEMDAAAVHVSAKVGLAELLLSGATTVADHLYLFPNGTTLEDEIRAARELGVRFHPTRGSMSLGESKGGLPPDHLCQPEEEILRDSRRVIETFHDAERYSMLRIGLAPCSPFSVTPALMRESARLARSYPRVSLHTHLAETVDEDRFCQTRFGKRPLEHAESLEWVGDDVWFAHMVHPNPQEIGLLARTRTGVCHCPTSNMILASGIAPVRSMIDAGVNVGLGVDGSASNDGNHLLGEARQAMLLQRVGWPGFESRADRFPAREALELATLGGARVLGRDDVGALAPGMAADLVAFRVDDLAHAGSASDPVAALVTCAPARVTLSVINGRIVVEDGELRGIDLDALVASHNDISRALLERARLA
ncbi:MAG TPA: 8-oxoguanine deaminase [Burkholderiaceae bacterium]|nr:8-oxoguanine deaminase [Burkholderiaceae bacterium]